MNKDFRYLAIASSDFTRWFCPSVPSMSVRLFVVHENEIFSKTEQFRAMIAYRKSYMGFAKNPLLDP